jgi:hypothetical protein
VPSKSARPARRRGDDLERLLEAADHVVLGQPEGMTLLARVPGAEPEDEPSAADLVQRLDHLGGDRGIAMQGGQDPGADLHLRGRRGHGPVIATLSHQPWIDPSARRHSNSSGIQTLSNPHRLSPEGPLADLDPARGRAIRPRFLHRKHETEFDGAHGLPMLQRGRV